MVVINDLGDKKFVYFRNVYRYKNEKLKTRLETHKVYLEVLETLAASVV
jgi:hypothetical protein